MQNINLIIDGKQVDVKAGSTILQAAKNVGIDIPTLCYLEDQKIKANCRVCLVEIKGRELQTACSTLVSEGMEVQTNNLAVNEARKISLKLILSHHPMDCQSCVRLGNSHAEDLLKEVCESCFFCDCVRDGDCELQKLVADYDIYNLGFEWQQRTEDCDTSTASIVKNPNKCIMCRRCVATCGEIQDIHVWSISGRGNESHITTNMNIPLASSQCVECGQCVRSCPVGALYETQELDDILDAAADKTKKVIARIEPTFMKNYLELSELDEEKHHIGHLIAGLHRIGVDVVVKNGLAEEETIASIKQELMDHDVAKPIISALCPASVSFVEKNFPKLINCLSKVPSPQQLFDMDTKADRNTYTVSLSACSARKAEAAREGHDGQIDSVISPREINRIFGRSGADLKRLAPKDFDIEQGDNILEGLHCKKAGIETDELQIEGKNVKVAAAYGLKAARELLKQVDSGENVYDYIQLQACPKGCISTVSWLKK